VNPFVMALPAAVAVTAGVAAYGAMHPRSQLFGPTIRHTNSAKKLAITFDDGPNPVITPKLLDLLDRNSACATFFLIGNFVRQCPELTREILTRGHSIGNHTQTHPNLFKCNESQIRSELTECNSAIAEVTGEAPKWFRPPYGFRNFWVIPTANELGQQAVMWTLIPGDWRAKSTEWLIPRIGPIAQHAKRNANDKNSSLPVREGDILCLHDGNHRTLNADRSPTLGALEYWLPRWRDLGLEFVTINEAVGEPAL
jgi:peptidoglycan/xylan/chitin deacetylase (PgdA/CDA1 family)